MHRYVIIFFQTVLTEACLALLRTSKDHEVLTSGKAVNQFDINIMALHVIQRDIPLDAEYGFGTVNNFGRHAN